MNTQTVSEHEVNDPLVEKERQRRLEYYKSELETPTREIPLEKRHKQGLNLSEWFSLGGGI